jgi:hypothetical protein
MASQSRSYQHKGGRLSKSPVSSETNFAGNDFKTNFLLELARQRNIKNSEGSLTLENQLGTGTGTTALTIGEFAEQDILASYQDFNFDSNLCSWQYISNQVLSSDPHSKFIRNIFDSKKKLGKRSSELRIETGSPNVSDSVDDD